MKVIYLLAASHSGSTLTAMLLGAHPDISTVGELKLNTFGEIDKYLCSCKEKILACEFWGEIERRMKAKALDFTLRDPGTHYGLNQAGWVERFERPLYRGGAIEVIRDIALSFSPSRQKQLSRAHLNNPALISEILDVTNTKCIVDSSKIGSRLKYLLRSPKLDVYVVRIVRNGRAVAQTYMDPEKFADSSDAELRGGGAGLSRENERLTMEEAAYEWKRSNEEADAILKTVDSNHKIQIRYEELCTNTVDCLANVYTMLGLSPFDQARSFRRNASHVIGNGMRLDSTDEVILDERWRDSLSKDDMRAFDEVAGRLNRSLGYD